LFFSKQMTEKTTHSYRPDIDGLRAVAVLAVVIFHAFPVWLPGGFVGVDIFFVISGYLITGIIVSAVQADQFSVRRFYARRVLRIFPALIVVLVSCLAFGWFVLLKDEYQELGKHTVAGVAFVQNFMLWSESSYFAVPAELKVLLHLWSLGIEEQFYIFWPLVLFLAFRLKIKLGIVVVVLGCLSLFLNIYEAQRDVTTDFYSPLTRMWELLVGALLAVNVKDSSVRTLSENTANTLSVLGCIAIVLSLTLINRDLTFPGYLATLPVFGSACLLASGPRSWLGKVAFSNKLMVWVGLLSYPLYLWHWPLLTFAKILENGTPVFTTRLMLMGLAVVLAWLTYRLVERPLRFNTSHRHLIVLVLSGSMCIIAAMGYLIYQNDGFSSRRVVLENVDTADHMASDFNVAGLCADLKADDFLTPFCQQRSAVTAGKTIVVWGDSSVVAWSPVLETIAKQDNYTLVRIAMLACPPILDAGKVVFSYAPVRLYCSEGTSQQKVLDYLRKIKPDMVVVIAAWNQYSGDPAKELLLDRRQETRAATAETTQQVLERNLPETLKQLSAMSKVLVFRSWPILTAPPNTRVISRLGVSKYEAVAPQAEFEKDTKRVNQIFDSLASPQIRFFSPADKVCDGVVCHSERLGVRFYSDPYHITPRGSLSFKDELQRVISQMLEQN
jgi:peptidoglycan/LPS O-acetylase OafA/YrhL